MSQRIRGKRGSGSVARRGDRWELRRSDTDPVTGRRRRWRESFDTEAEALRAQALPTHWTPDAATAAHEWILAWSVTRSAELRLNDQVSSATACERNAAMLARRLGRVPLGKIDKRFLSKLWLDLLTKPRSPTDHRPYKRKYVADCRTTLSQALRDAEADGVIRSNPSRLAPLPKQKVTSGRKETPMFTPEEFGVYVRSLWATAQADDRSDWVLPTLVACYTGCRRGEALGLRWCDIGEHSVTFDQQVNKVQGRCFVDTLKTPKAYRTVGIRPELVAALKEERERLNKSSSSRELIIQRNLPDPDAFSSWVRRSQTRAGVPTLNVHALRHTVASHLIVAVRATPVAVAELLGHKNAAFTQDRYTHLWPKELADTGTALGDFIDASIGDSPII